MADPKNEHGFTAISNELLEALVRTNLSGQELRTLLFFIRKLDGFHKTEDAISLSQIMRATGMIKVRASQVVNNLELMKILTVTKNINGIGKSYKLNKDFDSWETVKENINRYKKLKQTVNKNINKGLIKTLTTKDKKEKKESARATPSPGWEVSGSPPEESKDLPFPERWKDFIEHMLKEDPPLYAVLANLKVIENTNNGVAVFTGPAFVIRQLDKCHNDIETRASAFFGEPVSIDFKVMTEEKATHG